MSPLTATPGMSAFRTLALALAPALILLAGGAGLSWASPTVRVSLHPEAAQAGQSVQLEVTVDGATGVDGEPRVPPVEGLRFRRAGQQTNFSLVNGRMSRSITFQFVVLADKPGEYTLGPVEVQVGKEVLRSERVKLQVVSPGSPIPGTSAPPSGGTSGEDGLVFVEAEVDRNQAYLGQQVTLRLRFYQAVGFRVLETQLEAPPSTTGFLREEIPPQRTRTASVGGRSYQVTEIVYGLFPTQTGTLEIGPATLRCMVQDRRSRSGRRDPFDIFGMFEEREVTLRSRPLRVEVLALPRPRPESFTGGVGSFRMTSKVDRSEVEQNEPVTLTLSLQGTGNIAAVGPPAVPEIPGFRTFDGAAPTVLPQQSEDRLGGTKTFQIVLVPETTGNLIIPPFELSYFRPSNQSYQSLSSDSVHVLVTPGTGFAGDSGVSRLGWDLRAIRETTKLRASGGDAPWRSLPFWILQGGPLALLAGAWVARRRKDREVLHGVRLSRERAPGRLRREIEELTKAPGDAGERLRLLDGIWTRYMEDRFGFALRGRTRDELAHRLAAEGYDDGLIAEITGLLADLDFARFAPGDSLAVDDLLSRSREVAARLGRPGNPARPGTTASTVLLVLAMGAAFSADGKGGSAAEAAQDFAIVAEASAEDPGRARAVDSGRASAEDPGRARAGDPGRASAEDSGGARAGDPGRDSAEDEGRAGGAEPALPRETGLAGNPSGGAAGPFHPGEPGSDPMPAQIDRSQAEAWFSEGNRSFQAGQTRRAAELYLKILSSGYESPEVWLNLGNAYFRLGQRGWAVHAFESGRRMSPGDPDLRSNLDLALRDVESAPDVRGNRVLEALAASRDEFPLRRVLPWLTAVWWGLAAWAAWAVYRRAVGRAGVVLGLLLGLVWLSGLGWIGVLAVQAHTRPDSVVVVESAPVRSNPDTKATVEFQLPEGTLVRTGREVPGFVEVLYSGELRGWTAAEGVGRIGPSAHGP